jgi:hypothetical protein
MTATYPQSHHSIPGTREEAGNPPAAALRHAGTSKKALWTGRILSGLVVLFMLFDALMKVLQLPVAVQGTTQLGYPESVVFGLGLVQLACLVLYLVPRTSVLGAVLWTGYLGGAIATHVRLGNPLFSHILFPVYVAAFFWAGLWLRDERLRAVLPFRATK